MQWPLGGENVTGAAPSGIVLSASPGRVGHSKEGVERNGGERQGMEVRVEFSRKTESGDGRDLSNLTFTPLNRGK